MPRAGFLIALLALVLLGACETQEGYRKQLTQYRGETVKELVEKWGEPAKVSKLDDGREVWVYESVKELPRGGYFDHQYYRTRAKFENEEGDVTTRRFVESRKVWVPRYMLKSECNTHFVIAENHVVAEFAFRGNGCLANEWGI